MPRYTELDPQKKLLETADKVKDKEHFKKYIIDPIIHSLPKEHANHTMATSIVKNGTYVVAGIRYEASEIDKETAPYNTLVYQKSKKDIIYGIISKTESYIKDDNERINLSIISTIVQAIKEQVKGDLLLTRELEKNHKSLNESLYQKKEKEQGKVTEEILKDAQQAVLELSNLSKDKEFQEKLGPQKSKEFMKKVKNLDECCKSNSTNHLLICFTLGKIEQWADKEKNNLGNSNVFGRIKDIVSSAIKKITTSISKKENSSDIAESKLKFEQAKKNLRRNNRTQSIKNLDSISQSSRKYKDMIDDSLKKIQNIRSR